jgi:hypothetical protein
LYRIFDIQGTKTMSNMQVLYEICAIKWTDTEWSKPPPYKQPMSYYPIYLSISLFYPKSPASAARKEHSTKSSTSWPRRSPANRRVFGLRTFVLRDLRKAEARNSTNRTEQFLSASALESPKQTIRTTDHIIQLSQSGLDEQMRK